MTTSGGIPQVLPTFFFDMGLSLILVLTKQAGQQALPPLHWLYKLVPLEAEFLLMWLLHMGFVSLCLFSKYLMD